MAVSHSVAQTNPPIYPENSWQRFNWCNPDFFRCSPWKSELHPRPRGPKQSVCWGWSCQRRTFIRGIWDFPRFCCQIVPGFVPRAQDCSRGWKTSALGAPLPPERVTEPGNTTPPHPSEQLLLCLWGGVLPWLRSFFFFNFQKSWIPTPRSCGRLSPWSSVVQFGMFSLLMSPASCW